MTNRVEQAKRNSVSTSNHVLFYLLYKHINDDVSDDFPKIPEHFPKISEDSPKQFRRPDKLFGTFPEIFRRLPRKTWWCFNHTLIPYSIRKSFFISKLFVFLNKDWSWRRGGDVSISQKKSEDDQHETADFWWDLYKESAKTKRLTEILLLSDLAFEMQRGWRRPCLYTDLDYLTSLHLYMYMRKSYACIKARSPPASLAIIGQVTETHNWQNVHRYRDTSTG